MNSVIKKLTPFDFITLVYLTITGLFAIAGLHSWTLSSKFILIRIVMISVILLFIYLSNNINKKWWQFFRNFYPLIFISYLYGETGNLNNFIFNDLDPRISSFEQKFFGFQPSLEFCSLVPNRWFNELMHLGYFSYYLMTFFVCLVVYLKARNDYNYVMFIILNSFYLYYLFFIIFPVVGPQFYFPYPQSAIPEAYVFGKLIEIIKQLGETPTGAFPSSHVGMALVFLYLGKQYSKILFTVMLPFAVLLTFATVYIKAHYLIDVIGGIISAPIVYLVSVRCFRLILSLLKISNVRKTVL
jgi:membrane-associated phospholipid phosphatase